MCFVGELWEKFPHTPLKSFLSKIIQLDWFAKFVYGGTPRTSSPTKKAKRRNKCAVFLYLSSSLNFHFLPFVRVLFGRGAGEPFFAKKVPPRSL